MAVKSVPHNLQGGGDGPSANFGLRKLPEKKETLCRMCSGDNHPEGKKRRSRTVCVKCGQGVHAECLVKHSPQTTLIPSEPPTLSSGGRSRSQSLVSSLLHNMTRAPLSGKHLLNCKYTPSAQKTLSRMCPRTSEASYSEKRLQKNSWGPKQHCVLSEFP
ncbi:hypothetical protein J6590_073203 [Homalodisca vitripennis]|nr:hypothetical protein J6590_073203 [Homalodisca vitripennis]